MIVIRGSPGDLQPRVVEYVTDDVTLEAALGTAQQIAREFIDRQWALRSTVGVPHQFGPGNLLRRVRHDAHLASGIFGPAH